MKIYSNAPNNVAYIEGVGEFFTGSLSASSPTANKISIYHTGVNVYEVANVNYTSITDGSGNAFASVAACLAYLAGVFVVLQNAFYKFDQISPLQVWNINHNLGYYPNLKLYSIGGAEIEADVLNISVNQVQITFLQPTSGFARLF